MAVLAVVLAGALACGCGPSAAAEGHTDGSSRSAPTAAGPTSPPPQQGGEPRPLKLPSMPSGRTSTRPPPRSSPTSTGSSRRSMRRAVPEARTDELAAQADYDRFRALESDDDQMTAATLDELAGDVGAHQSFGGLHAVERDLWTSGDAARGHHRPGGPGPGRPVPAGQGGTRPRSHRLHRGGRVELGRRYGRPGPRGAVLTARRRRHRGHGGSRPRGLRLPSSHSGTWSPPRSPPPSTSCSPGCSARSDPSATPTQFKTEDISAAIRLSLSQQVDATAARLSQLAAALVPFGTTGPSS